MHNQHQPIQQTCKFNHYIKFNHLLFCDMINGCSNQANNHFESSAAFPCKKDYSIGLADSLHFIMKEWEGSQDPHLSFLQILPADSPLIACDLGGGTGVSRMGRQEAPSTWV